MARPILTALERDQEKWGHPTTLPRSSSDAAMPSKASRIPSIALGATRMGAIHVSSTAGATRSLIIASPSVLITFLGFADLEAHNKYMTALGRNPIWRGEIYPALVSHLLTRPLILRLAPTSRSQLGV
jgi:hypothetical protein